MRHPRFLMACMAFSVHTLAIHAQDYVAKGVVVDNTHTPIPGVTILEEGTTNGQTTDLDGKFPKYMTKI